MRDQPKAASETSWRSTVDIRTWLQVQAAYRDECKAHAGKQPFADVSLWPTGDYHRHTTPHIVLLLFVFGTKVCLDPIQPGKELRGVPIKLRHVLVHVRKIHGNNALLVANGSQGARKGG